MVIATHSLRNVARAVATLLGNGVRRGRAVDPAQLQPMVYPYTITASAIQFDWIFMFKQCWWPRYYLYANIICYPLWVWIHFKGECRRCRWCRR